MRIAKGEFDNRMQHLICGSPREYASDSFRRCYHQNLRVMDHRLVALQKERERLLRSLEEHDKQLDALNQELTLEGDPVRRVQLEGRREQIQKRRHTALHDLDELEAQLKAHSGLAYEPEHVGGSYECAELGKLGLRPEQDVGVGTPQCFTEGHALLVGVGDDLPETVEDATAIHEVLIDPDKAGYLEQQVTLLTEKQATGKRILRELDELAARVTCSSTVLFFFSGHGGRVPAVGERAEHFLVPNDYRAPRWRETSIPSQEITKRLEAIASKTRKLLVLLDCCHANGIRMVSTKGGELALTAKSVPAPPDLVELLEKGNGQVLIASSGEEEKSFGATRGASSSSTERLSLFTRVIIEAMDGRLRPDPDKLVRVLDLAIHLFAEVPLRSAGAQNPVLHVADLRHNFALCRYPPPEKTTRKFRAVWSQTKGPALDAELRRLEELREIFARAKPQERHDAAILVTDAELRAFEHQGIPREMVTWMTPRDPDEQLRRGVRVGIITSLPFEHAAMRAMLDQPRSFVSPEDRVARRPWRFDVGAIHSEEAGKDKCVALAAPAGSGTNQAAACVSALLAKFPHIEVVIMVGIAGAVPNPDKPGDHVRLGDIVVSSGEGIIQYDFVEQHLRRQHPRHPSRPPAASILDAVRLLQSRAYTGERPWLAHIERGSVIEDADRPPDELDVLHDSHKPAAQVKHPADPNRKPGQPRVFYGPIASANRLLRNPKRRDALRDQYKVKAVEMEGSGVADATWTHDVGYLVVRGTCDYCDSYKSDVWQNYAAVIAAAYVRALVAAML